MSHSELKATNITPAKVNRKDVVEKESEERVELSAFLNYAGEFFYASHDTCSYNGHAYTIYES